MSIDAPAWKRRYHEQLERIAALEAQVAELEGSLPGRMKGCQALADEKCRCFLLRAEDAEARVAAYNTNGFADADAMASAYLDMRIRAETTEARNRQLREAMHEARDFIVVVDCEDGLTTDGLIEKIDAALAATEPKP